MFNEFEEDGTAGMLAQLEAQLPMLPDSAREFVLACRLAYDMGSLDAKSKLQLRQVFALLVHTGHNTMGNAAPLSMEQVVKDLSSAHHMLSKEELAFVTPVAGKIMRKQALEAGEVQRLLQIHAQKGF